MDRADKPTRQDEKKSAPADFTFSDSDVRAPGSLYKSSRVESKIVHDDQRLLVSKTLNTSQIPRTALVQLISQIEDFAQLSINRIATYDHIQRGDRRMELCREFVDGSPLNELIQGRSIGVENTLQVGIEVSGLLEQLHQRNLVHQNLKPSNLICDDFYEITLVDTSLSIIALSIQNRSDLGRPSAVRYLSPEQLGIVKQPIGTRSDLFSLGAVLFECLTGETFFDGEEVSDIVRQHMSNAGHQKFDLLIRYPDSLAEIIKRLLSLNPGHRYTSVTSLREDLVAIADAFHDGQDNPQIALGTTEINCAIREPSFVGREDELKRITVEIDNLVAGNAGLAIIEGLSGDGKSFFLDKVSQQCIRRNCWTLRGCGKSDVAQRSFEMFQEIAQQIADRCASDASFAKTLDERAGDEKSELAAALPFLAETLGWEPNKINGPEYFGDTRAARALVRLLEILGTAEQPVVVIFDDSQWADTSTLNFFKFWVHRNKKISNGNRHVLMLLSFRKEEVGPRHLLRELSPTSHLKLAKLDRHQMIEVAQSMAGWLPQMAIELICQSANGSPFFVTATVRGMVESGALRSTKKGWQIEIAALKSFQSSSAAGDLLASRIDLFPEATLGFLCVGAVIGKTFNVETAVELSAFDRDTVSQMIDELREKHIIRVVSPDECVFLHDKIRNALLEKLSVDLRKDVHLRIANFIEKNYSDKVVDLAFHFDAAGENERALKYALISAEHAKQHRALQLAEQQYRIAERAEFLATDEQKFDIAEGLGEVLMLMGKYDQAESRLSFAETLANTKLDRAKINCKIGDLEFKRGNMESSVLRVEAAMRILGAYVPKMTLTVILLLMYEVFVQVLHTCVPRFFVERLKRLPTENERLLLRLRSRYAHACWFARGKSRCMWTHFRTLNHAERYVPTLELAQAYSDHAPAMSLVPYPSRGIEYAKKSLKIRRELNHLWGQGQSLHYWGIVLYGASRFEECIVTCRKAVDLLMRTGDYWEVHIARYQIAASLYRLGRLDEARVEAKQIYQSGLELGDYQASAMSLDIWARTQIGFPNQEVFDRELARKRHDAQGTAQLLLGQGVKHIGHRNYSDAVNSFQQALTIAQETGIRITYVITNYSWLATALRCQAEQLTTYHTDQRKKLLKALKYARLAVWHSRSFTNDLPHALRELGLIQCLLGRKKRGLGYIRKSLKVAEKFGFVLETRLSKIAMKLVIGSEEELELLKSELILVDTAGDMFLVGNDLAERNGKAATMSLADQFNGVIVAGRAITSAVSESGILKKVENVSRRLMRATKTIILPIDQLMHKTSARRSSRAHISDQSLEDVMPVLMQRAIEQDKTVRLIKDKSETESTTDIESEFSLMATPIFARDQLKFGMITIHHDIKNFFSENEERLADFVATIAGAALENADGFAKLQTLNETLENRVVQRTADLQNRATELADAKKELEIAKSRAEQASEAKSSFLATMSHEIRTPMNAVIGMTELCLNTEMTPVQLDYLSVVKQSAKSLLRLLNDILDFSKVEANKLELEKVEFDLHSIVEESSQALNINAVTKNVEIICRISPDVPRKVVGDAGRFRQILINLIGNAIKFTDEGEVLIDIQTRSCDDNTVQLHCSVNDTGIGIPAEYRASIFESFKQADSSTTRRYGGTGLGLAICSRLVGLMDGEIWIEGNGDRGTSFQFTPKFDIAKSDSSSAASPSFLQHQRTAICTRFGHTALVVKEMVESAGGQVSIVTSLQEPQGISLEKFDHRAANLVVFDLEYCEDGIGRLFEFAADRAKIADAKTIILYPANEAEICEQVDHPHVAFASKPLTRLKFESALSSLFGNDENSSAEGSTIIGDTEVESMHILLAEDVKINQRVAGEMLKLMGHTVEFANNGVEALEKIQIEKFDVVLMDIEMPEMDGIEATRRIRELEKTTGLYQPVVAMTAHVVEKFQKECERVGMDGYISKPIEPEQIAAELAKIAHGF